MNIRMNLHHTAAGIMLAAMPLLIHAAPGEPTLKGCVIYADGWTTQQNEMGMYQIPTSADGEFVRLSDTHINASSGGVLVGDTYWTCYFVDMSGTPFPYIFSYDAETWEEKGWQYGDVPHVSTGVCYDPTTKQVYGCFRDNQNMGYVFGTIDYNQLKRTQICKLDRMWSAIMVDRSGQIYCIDDLGKLHKVDKTTGAMTLIGDLGKRASHPSSATIDLRSGRCFYALTSDNKGSLYEINLSDATMTLLCDFPNNQEIVGLYTETPTADDNAPDEVSDATLTFAGGSLQGTLSFTAPASTFGGTSGSGELSWRLCSEDATVASGTCDWGGSVSAPVTVAERGNREFTLRCSNTAGDGPATEFRMYVGHDDPMAPTLTATRTGNDVSLSWNAVTESVNGGFVDFDNISYTVTRLPDGKEIVKGTKALTASDIIDPDGDLRSYHYVLTASDGTTVSADASSPAFWTGVAAIPWSVTFDTEDSWLSFTTIDGNADGITWDWSARDKAVITKFNRAKDGNDWLVTPAVRLEKGKVYRFAVNLRTYLGNPETAEIKWGDAPTAEAMTNTLLAPTQIKTRETREYAGYIAPAETGLYYIGLHHISPAAETWYLYADGMTISEPVSVGIPAAVDNFEVKPDYNGALTADINLSAPLKSVGDSDLSDISKVVVFRNGSQIKEFINPAPGDKLGFTDTLPNSGYFTYAAAAYNVDGEGIRKEIRVFVGPNTPARPEWAKIEETETPGEVTVSWSPVSKAEDGSALNPDIVSYDIVTSGAVEGDVVTVASGIKGSSHTFRAVAEGKQDVVFYAVRAITAGGSSLLASTDVIAVGTPYGAPYRESFAGGASSTILYDNSDGEGIWSVYTDESGIPSHDADGGFAAMWGNVPGMTKSLKTGKISLKNVTYPVLRFFTYNITGNGPDTNRLKVTVTSRGTSECLLDKTVAELVAALGLADDFDGWIPVSLPLTAFAGKDVAFELNATVGNCAFTPVDDIFAGNQPDIDLAAESIEAPAEAEVNQNFNIRAYVMNVGTKEVKPSVRLMVNGTAADTAEADTPMLPGELREFEFTYSFNATAADSNSIRFVVNHNEDGDASNNESREVLVRLADNFLPVPADLQGAASQQGVTLSWSAPDTSHGIPVPATEDFENFSDWSMPDGWSRLDNDDAANGSLENVEIPGMEYGSKNSWFIVDDSNLSDAFRAASGHRYISTIYCLPLGDFKYVTNDDWAMSPLLYGGRQTVTFKARSLNEAEAMESFQVLYSTSFSNSPEDFKLLKKVTDVPGEWTEYRFSLPEGAKRFAIRYDKTYGMMLHIDDVSFTVPGDGSLTLSGYNVYRNGMKVNDAPLSDPSHTETTLCTDFTEYAVSAVYKEKGESRACPAVRLKMESGIYGVSAPAIRIHAGQGEIVIDGAAGRTVNVFTADGKLAATATGSEFTTRIAVRPGLYIVTCGNSRAKLLVK